MKKKRKNPGMLLLNILKQDLLTSKPTKQSIITYEMLAVLSFEHYKKSIREKEVSKELQEV